MGCALRPAVPGVFPNVVETLGLMPELLHAIADQGYTEATPIQLRRSRRSWRRHDIMGCAQTGTGKTAGFALPILQMLAPQQSASPSPARHPIRALILTPTRELAAQVEESVRGYGKYLALRSNRGFAASISTRRSSAARRRRNPGGNPRPPARSRASENGQPVARRNPGADEADRMLDMVSCPTSSASSRCCQRSARI